MQQINFYCRSYCLLNMFRAPLCPSSGAREYYTKRLLPVVFGAVKMEIVIFRLAAIVFSVLSVVRYIRLLWGMSGVVGAVCVGVLGSFFVGCLCLWFRCPG